MTRKLLVYNIMEYSEKIRFFNKGIADILDDMELEADFYVFDGKEKLPAIEQYSHLIISGSEASAMDEAPWDNELSELIHAFVGQGKKILAICYGHQFLVKTLCGKDHVFKLPVPEYGYSTISLKPHKLFDGIDNPVVLELHHDAVKNLSPDFDIIAENETAIQAYQYRGMDVYGVQFHPEFDREAAQYFFDEARKAVPALPLIFSAKPVDNQKLKQNSLLIQNFLYM